MKRQIRRRVFETNSSSTHSVSIYNSTHRMYKDIPENSKIICDGTWRLGTDIFDEVGKLNYIIILIASIIEDISYSKDMDMGAPFEKMIEHNYFKLLKEVVKEQKNTDLIFIKPNHSYFPYYETTYDEDNSIIDILSDYGKYNLDVDSEFKERCKEIIFNKDILIEDKENEY